MARVEPSSCRHEASNFRETFAQRTDDASRKLNDLTAWAESLCQEGVARIIYRPGKKRFRPHLGVMPLGEGGTALFDIYNEESRLDVYICPYRTVFERLAPNSLARVEGAAGDTLRQNMELKMFSTQLLDALVDALHEASRATQAVQHRSSLPTELMPYRPKNENVRTLAAKVWERDPDKIDRGTASHRRLEKKLANLAKVNGLKPLRSASIDVAWVDRGILVVIEVKSTTAHNETRQLRLGLGQVLDYQDVEGAEFDSVRAVLAIEHPPSDTRWIDLCDRHGVKLVWPDTFSSLFR